MSANIKSIVLAGFVHAPVALLLVATLDAPQPSAPASDRLATFDVSTANSPPAEAEDGRAQLRENLRSAAATPAQEDPAADQPRPVIQLASANLLAAATPVLAPAPVKHLNTQAMANADGERGARNAEGKGEESVETSASSSSSRLSTSRSGSAGDASVDGYQDIVQRWIEGHKSFPQHLSAKGISGTVVVHFELDRRGNIFATRVLKSSGHRELDQLATRQLAMAAPYPRPSRDRHWQRRSFSVPMIYRVAG